MSAPALNATEVMRKAAASTPACVFVGEFSKKNRQDILIYALKDLSTSGIDAELVLAGAGDGGYVHYLTRLARFAGLERRLHFVRDVHPFTLSRVYRYSQYFLSVSHQPEHHESVLEAVRQGCIPVVGDGVYAQFFGRVEDTIRATFNNPSAYAKAHERAALAITR